MRRCAVSDLNFDDIAESFRVKSDMEILRALAVMAQSPVTTLLELHRTTPSVQVFKACSFPFIVKNSRKLLDLSETFLGKARWLLASLRLDVLVVRLDHHQVGPQADLLWSLLRWRIFR